MHFYEQNLKALIKQNSELGAQLFAISENKKFEVFVDEKDPLNINMTTSDGIPVYSGIPIEETADKADEFNKKFSRYPFLYFYGLGNGVFYKLLLQNIEHKRVVIVEPELELIYMALHFNDFVDDISKNRLIILENNQVSFAIAAVDIFGNQDAKIFSKTYHLEVLNDFYFKHYGENIIKINKIFTRAIEHVIYGLGNDSTDALIGLEHHIANAERMVETPTLLEFLKKATNTETAVIVSTGPSLKKQLPLLKKIQDHVTLFCIDSSFPILEKEGIKPDIVVSMERVIETALFFKNTSKEFHEDVVFATTSIQHPLLLDQIKAGTMCMSMRPFGYTRYFKLPEYGYVGIGMSAANMAFELVFHSKFKNCILIGQDLAYGDDGTTHSEDSLYGVGGGSKHSDSDVVAYGGDGSVRTTLLWNMFRNFFETDIHYANKNGMQTYNATEGGARIQGSIEKSFEEVTNTIINKETNKELIVLEAPSKELIEKKKEYMREKIEHMQEYAIAIEEEVSSLFEKVSEKCEELDKLNAYKNIQKINFDEIISLMEDIDKVKIKFSDQEFVDIFIDATQALIMHQELELAKIQVRNSQSDEEKKIKLLDWIYSHKIWLYTLAGLVNAVVVAIERRASESTVISQSRIVGNVIDGYMYDFEDPSKECKVDLYIDDKLEAIYEANIEMPTFLMTEDESQDHRFLIELPLKIYDNQMHTISLKEHKKEKYLHYATFKDAFLEDGAVSGDIYVHGKVPYMYTGWCKKVESSEVQEVDVYIDQEYEETIVADKPSPFTEFINDGDSKHGYAYVVPEKYFDEKEHTIAFTGSKSSIILNKEYKIFKLSEEEKSKIIFAKYILAFANELDVNSIKGYCTEQYSGFNGNESVNGIVETKDSIVYTGWCKHIGSLEPQQINIYIDGEFIETIIANKPNIFMKNKNIENIELGFEYIINNKKYCDGKTHKISFVTDGAVSDSYITFTLDDKKKVNIMENILVNKLDQNINLLELKNSYKKGSISFVAIEENIQDEDFILYVENLSNKYPKVTFKIFYFDENQIDTIRSQYFNIISKLELILFSNIYDITTNTQIYINSSKKSAINLAVTKILRTYCENIYVVAFAPSDFNNAMQTYSNDFIFNHKEFYNYTEEEYEMAENCGIKLVLNSSMKKLIGVNFEIDLSKTFYDGMLIDVVGYALEYKGFVQYMYDMDRRTRVAMNNLIVPYEENSNG
ncbi:MAG: DUF115 domain-containing protein [Helicobacteraceae bacterium]|nr:DUF115 domain-containing protein [Helicobacteraceae bacterium]